MADQDKSAQKDKDEKSLAKVEAEAKDGETPAVGKKAQPEEKEVADPKAQDVDADSVNKEEVSTEEEENPTTAAATATPEADEPKEDASPAIEKKKFKIGLPKLGKKEDGADKETKGLAKDKENKPADKSGADKSEVAFLDPESVLAQNIEEKLDTPGNYWVIKLRISTVLILCGVLIGLMWMIPLGHGVKVYLNERGVTFDLPSFGKHEDASASAELTEMGPKIRIRDASREEGAADKLMARLKDVGYAQVEVQIDSENEYEGLNLILKPGSDNLRAELVAVLGTDYTIGSPSAELTPDSDFDAVFLFGSGVEDADDEGEVQGDTEVKETPEDLTTDEEATSSSEAE